MKLKLESTHSSLDLHSFRRLRNAFHEASPSELEGMAAPTASTAVGRRRCRSCSNFRVPPLRIVAKLRLMRLVSQVLLPRRDGMETVVKREGSWQCDADGNAGVAFTFDILKQE